MYVYLEGFIVFEKIKSRKYRGRRGTRLRRSGGMRGISRMGLSNLGPVLKIGGLFVAVAALVLLVIFVVVPLFGGSQTTAEPSDAEISTPAPTAKPIANAIMADDAEELVIEYNSINDPYICGNEVVFSTGNALQVSPELTTIAIYDMDTQQTAEVSGITKRNISLFEPKINQDYIVYLDSKTEYGGAVCGYDRNKEEMFVMREYLYGKPKVTLVGEYALWMQQTQNATDKLYLYHLPTKESTAIEVFVNTPFSVSTPHMSDEAIVYVQPVGESQVLDGSSASLDAEVCVMPLKDKGDQERILFSPGTYVYGPMIDGDNIVFLDGNRNDTSRLMLCTKSGDTYSSPVEIANGILNFDVGDGFVSYTKDEAVYIYYFKDGSSARISSETTRALLSSANGKEVVWYDVTDGLANAANVIMHIQVP